MPESREHRPGPDGSDRPARALPLFAEFSRARQAVTIIAVPIVVGALLGAALRWSAWSWWTVQSLGVLGAFYAGSEHRRRWTAALRGACGGLIAAAAVLTARASLSGEDVADFDPASYPIYAAIASAGLHAGGTILRRRTPSPAGATRSP